MESTHVSINNAFKYLFICLFNKFVLFNKCYGIMNLSIFKKFDNEKYNIKRSNQIK